MSKASDRRNRYKSSKKVNITKAIYDLHLVMAPPASEAESEVLHGIIKDFLETVLANPSPGVTLLESDFSKLDITGRSGCLSTIFFIPKHQVKTEIYDRKSIKAIERDSKTNNFETHRIVVLRFVVSGHYREVVLNLPVNLIGLEVGRK